MVHIIIAANNLIDVAHIIGDVGHIGVHRSDGAIQLAFVYRIGGIHAVGHIGDGVAAIIQAVFAQAHIAACCAVANGDAVAVHHGVAGGEAVGLQVFGCGHLIMGAAIGIGARGNHNIVARAHRALRLGGGGVGRGNRVIDIVFTGAANVAHGGGAVCIHLAVATQNGLVGIGNGFDLAAVHRFSAAGRNIAAGQAADFVGGAVDFHATHIHGVKADIFGRGHGVDGLAIGTGGAAHLDVFAFFHLGFCTRSRFLHITDIGCVGGGVTAAGYIGDGFAAGINAATGHTRAVDDGQTIVAYFGVAHGNTAVAAQINGFGQLHRQRIGTCYHTDIALGQGAGVAAFHVNSFAQFAVNRRTAVARKGERLVGLIVRRFNRVVDVAFAGATNVGVGVNTGARIIGGVAADNVLHAFTLRKQLAAVHRIGAASADVARCQTADFVGGAVNFHISHLHGVKAYVFGSGHFVFDAAGRIDA